MATKCRKICVGDLNIEITVQKPMMTPDGQGGFKPTEWVEWFRFWASVEWKGGGERDVAGKVQAYSSAKITAAWDARLKEDLRLVFKGMILNIRSVTNWQERNYIMDVDAELGVGT